MLKMDKPCPNYCQIQSKVGKNCFEALTLLLNRLIYLKDPGQQTNALQLHVGDLPYVGVIFHR